MNRDLLLSILAMDSYNREYGAGLVVGGTSLGKAQIITRASLGITDATYDNWRVGASPLCLRIGK